MIPSAEWLSVGGIASSVVGVAVGVRHLSELRRLRKGKRGIRSPTGWTILDDEMRPILIQHIVPVSRSRRRRLGDAIRQYAAPLDGRRFSGSRRKPPPRIDIPAWSLVLLSHDDAERYRCEFGAHLWQLVAEEQFKLARRARRRFAVAAVTLAVVLRVRHVLVRARPR